MKGSKSGNHKPLETEEKKPEVERDQWGSKIDFILVCVGYCVGLSNVWRFPYLCYKNGGGAFLIPYVLVLLICVMPMLCMEMGFGQYFGLGALPIWNIAPLFKGLGWTYTLINLFAAAYYVVLLAWAIRYFVASCTTTLPWTTCDNYWNTPNCYEGRGGHETAANTSALLNFTEVANETSHNFTGKPISATEEYWTNRILNLSTGFTDVGQIQWELLICLLVAWIIIALIIIKGIKTSGKVVYFTATFPYVMLTILVIRGATLPGSLTGITYYLYPDFEKLSQPSVWYSAAIQVFWSVGPGWGSFITMASYNKFRNRCFRDAILTASINCLTSLYAGFALFSVLGYMSVESGIDIEYITTSGPGLAFVAYPRAIATMPAAPFWALLFFFMIILLGIDSQIVYVETVSTCISDEFPVLRKRKWLMNSTLCAILFVIGLVFVTQGGYYILTFFDWYCAGTAAITAAILECIIICWIYGINKFSENIRVMLGTPINKYVKISWSLVAPFVTAVIFVLYMVYFSGVVLGDYIYPSWANALGWFISIIPLMPIPVIMVYRVFKAKGSISERLTLLLQEDPSVHNHANKSIEEEKCRREGSSDSSVMLANEQEV